MSDDTNPRAAVADQITVSVRTRLVPDVTTGKLDARDVAARLPDESGALGILDSNHALF